MADFFLQKSSGEVRWAPSSGFMRPCGPAVCQSPLSGGSRDAITQRWRSNRTTHLSSTQPYATDATVLLGGARTVSLASRRSFWAMATNVNSNCAPFGPRSRSLTSRRMRFRWASNMPIVLAHALSASELRSKLGY